jgi:hypothetical protein
MPADGIRRNPLFLSFPLLTELDRSLGLFFKVFLIRYYENDYDSPAPHIS